MITHVKKPPRRSRSCWSRTTPATCASPRRRCKEGKVYNNLHWAKDGVEALDSCKRQGKHADAPRPDMILLDLNLPKKDGREVLPEIKKDAS